MVVVTFDQLTSRCCLFSLSPSPLSPSSTARSVSVVFLPSLDRRLLSPSALCCNVSMEPDQLYYPNKTNCGSVLHCFVISYATLLSR